MSRHSQQTGQPFQRLHFETQSGGKAAQIQPSGDRELRNKHCTLSYGCTVSVALVPALCGAGGNGLVPVLISVVSKQTMCIWHPVCLWLFSIFLPSLHLCSVLKLPQPYILSLFSFFSLLLFLLLHTFSSISVSSLLYVPILAFFPHLFSSLIFPISLFAQRTLGNMCPAICLSSYSRQICSIGNYMRRPTQHVTWLADGHWETKQAL